MDRSGVEWPAENMRDRISDLTARLATEAVHHKSGCGRSFGAIEPFFDGLRIICFGGVSWVVADALERHWEMRQ